MNTEPLVETMQNIEGNNSLFTGIEELDRLTGGIKTGQVIVIGGRPGTGKTKLALKMVKNLIANKTSICYYSLEMNKNQAIKRLVAQEKITIDDMLELFIYDYSKNSISDLSRNIRTICFNYSKPRIIIIDYIQLVTDSHLPEIWEELKTIAVNERITVVVLSQLDRTFEFSYNRQKPLDYLYLVNPIPEKIDFTYLIQGFHQ
jgi:replicative DNA helicase